MKRFAKFLFLPFLFMCLVFTTHAQVAEDIITESSVPEDTSMLHPLDDIVEKKMVQERLVLDYEPVREGDLFWEKRVWRVIDTREKLNQIFVYPEAPLFKIMADAASKGDIRVYSTENDKFTVALSVDDVMAKMSSTDTVTKVNTETYEEEIVVTRNDIDYTKVQRFRLKEIWYFDSESSTLKVRILGIAPIMDKTDDAGNFLYENPLFWVYYPDARALLSKNLVFNAGNDASPLTWYDIFEMRLFSSFIIKTSNVQDNRLVDYTDLKENGVDRLLESERIKAEIFNFEHDLWSY